MTNAARVAGEAPGGNTADPSDDIVRTDAVTVTATQTAQLTLAKVGDTTSYTAVGQRIRYTLTLINTGNVTVTNVRIADNLPGMSALTSPRRPGRRSSRPPPCPASAPTR